MVNHGAEDSTKRVPLGESGDIRKHSPTAHLVDSELNWRDSGAARLHPWVGAS
jgi:hypothetical protein